MIQHPLPWVWRGVLQLDMVPEKRQRLAVSLDKGKERARQLDLGHVIRTPINDNTFIVEIF